jgi:hypothetical protein
MGHFYKNTKRTKKEARMLSGDVDPKKLDYGKV